MVAQTLGLAVETLVMAGSHPIGHPDGPGAEGRRRVQMRVQAHVQSFAVRI
jgi:hypothetical protein